MSLPSIDCSELVENPTARVPVVLCLDSSGSMAGAPIQELNDGVSALLESIRSDELARFSAEIAIVTYGGVVHQALDFGSADRSAPVLSAWGGTPMGEGVNAALDLLEVRKKQYSESGVDYYQPWLVLMTDGQPTDSIDSAAARTVALLEKRKLTIFPIAIGEGADVAVLARFSPSRQPLRLQGLNFRAFFEWLSRSVSRVSQSVPGQTVSLDAAGIKGWAEI